MTRRDPFPDWMAPVFFVIILAVIIAAAAGIYNFVWFEQWFRLWKEGLAVFGLVMLLFLPDIAGHRL